MTEIYNKEDVYDELDSYALGNLEEEEKIIEEYPNDISFWSVSGVD